MLATHWPFSRDAMTRALEEATSRPVEIGSFRSSYFPPGCMAENVRVLHNSRPGGTPLITIQKLIVVGSLTGMITSPKRLAEVKIIGMHVRIPGKGPNGEGDRSVALNGGDSGKSLTISKIVADGTLLEFLPSEPGDKPYQLRIDGLIIRDVGAGKPMTYRANLTNTEPPGVIRAEGKFGPWNPKDPGVTPVAGSFLYNDVNLGKFEGISGTLQAKGTFNGPLAHIQAEGTTETPDFHVSGSGTAVRMTVGFHAIVNGTNGDTSIEPADAHFLRTEAVVRGAVEGHSGEKGKTATLAIAIANGRIEDVLRLFVHDKDRADERRVERQREGRLASRTAEVSARKSGWTSISGSTTASSRAGARKRPSTSSGRADWANPRRRSRRIRGPCSPTSAGILRFATESGHSVMSRLRCRALRRSSTALTDSSIAAWICTASSNTEGRLSDTTSGFKAVVVKLITPFFKKKHDVKIVPFKITGTFDNASVSLD